MNHWLQIFWRSLETSPERDWKLFEATPEFYAKLETGDEGDVLAAAQELAAHLELSVPPSVTYEWTLSMPEAAGRIRTPGTVLARIQIGLDYVGKPLALGAILAHELTHQVLRLRGIGSTDRDEDERLTDLAATALGLGKLMLNGVVTGVAPYSGESRILGYLSPELQAYAYRRVVEKHRVPKAAVRAGLTQEAIMRLEHCT